MTNKPVAVLISDVHYSVHTLNLADKSMYYAITKARELRVPLIVAGDLHDTKANLRGECVNAMIATFKLCKTPTYVLVGNHDRLNERSPEHSLNFLEPYATLVHSPITLPTVGCLLPYYNDPGELRTYLHAVPAGSRLIMHQGVHGSNMGDYVQDKSALPRECFADFRVISGHYHSRQNIKCGRPQRGAVGLFSYIGNPYTLNFGESDDPEKGFQILMEDGTLEFVSTNLRRHFRFDINTDTAELPRTNPEDLVWVTARGARADLDVLTKQHVAELLGRPDFRFDSICSDDTVQVQQVNTSQPEILDYIIEQLSSGSKDADRRKQLWRDLCES